MVFDICNWLDISPGKKSEVVNFPRFNKDTITWAFIRGYFDGDGHVASFENKKSYPICGITSNSKSMLDGLSTFISIKHSRTKTTIEFSGVNAIDFLSNLYDNANIYLNRKRQLFFDWANCWKPSLCGIGTNGRDNLLKWNKTRKDAQPPFKSRASDSGYDLTLLEKIKETKYVEFYDTGIKIEPAHGWYFDMVPRSSLCKSGYMLANNVGIIDRSYRGNIIVPLVKIDSNVEDLKLPIRGVQIIPRPIVHFELLEVEDLDDTERGDDGFGSTGG
jgi:dUTP pyrophosphatase